MKDYLEVINFRHACKIFDENRKIEKEDIEYILEAGRQSPSSIGFEQWDFIVVQNQKMREEIRAKSWGQVQVTSCSHLIVILAKISELKSDSAYLDMMVNRREDKNEQDRAKRGEFYRNFIKANFKDNDDLIFEWSHQQCLFAATNMMNAAAFKGIDSCPIEGFEREEVGKIIGIDPKKHRVAILIPFGYRLNEQPKKYRRDMKDMITWID